MRLNKLRSKCDELHGKTDSVDYENCEVFVIEVESRESATKKAQAKRSRQRKRDVILSAVDHQS